MNDYCATVGPFNTHTTQFLERLEASQILLVEWENELEKRLGVPLVSNGVCYILKCHRHHQLIILIFIPQDLFFLVADDKIPQVRSFAVESGLCPADQGVRPAYTSEHFSLAVRYLMDDKSYPLPADPYNTLKLHRLVFLPMIAWTGLRPDELIRLSPELPWSVWTVPLPAWCVAVVRMISREQRGGNIRAGLILALSSVLCYNFFDNSYEGDWMEIASNDTPLSEKEIAEIENAVATVTKWELRPEDDWVRQNLLDLVAGKMEYTSLPHQM
jgi:hypothetical protein